MLDRNRAWTLRHKLALLIIGKILLLTAFWMLVLKPQSSHPDAAATAKRLISSSLSVLDKGPDHVA